MQKKDSQSRPGQNFGIGDEVAYAMGRGLRYGRVVRNLGTGEQSAVEIEFEDGGRETHKSRDRALSLLRRASGMSAAEEQLQDRRRQDDADAEATRRGEQRRRK